MSAVRVAKFVGIGLIAYIAWAVVLRGIATRLMRPTTLRVTVVNRTNQPLTNGTWEYSPLRGIPPRLDEIAPGATVTYTTNPGSEEARLHFRVANARDDTVSFGYGAEGRDCTWIVAEGESLVVDSTNSIRDGQVARSWGRRQHSAETVAKPIRGR